MIKGQWIPNFITTFQFCFPHRVLVHAGRPHDPDNRFCLRLLSVTHHPTGLRVATVALMSSRQKARLFLVQENPYAQSRIADHSLRFSCLFKVKHAQSLLEILPCSTHSPLQRKPQTHLHYTVSSRLHFVEHFLVYSKTEQK